MSGMWEINFPPLNGSHEAKTPKSEFAKIPLSIQFMVRGDFGAASAMICFGVLLGKCNW
jgi:hypothetical protein